MRRRINRFFSKSNFRKEVRKELRLLIVVTLGFTIGFTWRQTIFDISQAFIKWLTGIEGTSGLSLLASTFITLVSVGFIYLSSYFLKERPGYE